MKKARRYLISVVLCFVLLQVVKHYVVQTIHIVGDSMSPTFRGRDNEHGGDYIGVEKITYRFRDPRKGEIVLITTKGLSNPILKRDARYVRRVAGIPGEKVKIGNEERELPAGEYLLTGDNMDTNIEARVIGPIRRENILGRAVFIYFPFTRLGPIE